MTSAERARRESLHRLAAAARRVETADTPAAVKAAREQRDDFESQLAPLTDRDIDVIDARLSLLRERARAHAAAATPTSREAA